MSWSKLVTVTAQVETLNLRMRLYSGDAGAPHPNDLYFDSAIPANTDWGAVYYGGYCGDALSIPSFAALTARVATAMAALADSVEVPDYEGPAQLELYYSDAGADPPFHPRVASYHANLNGYADISLAVAFPNETERTEFITLCTALRTYSLVQLEFTEDS